MNNPTLVFVLRVGRLAGRGGRINQREQGFVRFRTRRPYDACAEERMSDDLISLRAVVVTQTDGLADLFRQAAASLPVPIDIVETVDGGSLRRSLGGADLAYVDGALPTEELAAVMSALDAAPQNRSPS